MKKYNKFLLPLLSGILLLGIFLTGCTSPNNLFQGTPNGGENNMMDYNNAILRGVEYGWSSGSMARAEFFVEVNESEIVKARYYPEVTENWADDISTKEHVSITEDDWKSICDAVELLYPVLEEYSPSATEGLFSAIAGEQVLDGGDTFDFALTWEIDGELVRKNYYSPDYERFRVLSTILTELVDPIGREIPTYTPPVINGVYVEIGKKDGKDRYSFQCTQDKDAVGEYYFFCYYPENGKHTRYPESKVDEATWQVIRDKVAELGLDNPDVATTSGGDAITLYFTNGTQRKVKLNKDNGEALKKTFFEIMGIEPVQKKKSLWNWF